MTDKLNDKVAKKLNDKPNSKLLRLASVLTLAALALMVWSVLVPAPLPVMLAMSVGQVVGTAALGAYLWVVIRDVRGKGRTARASAAPPQGAPARHKDETP